MVLKGTSNKHTMVKVGVATRPSSKDIYPDWDRKKRKKTTKDFSAEGRKGESWSVISKEERRKEDISSFEGERNRINFASEKLREEEEDERERDRERRVSSRETTGFWVFRNSRLEESFKREEE